ncbi:MAG: 23S rRNA pseudouridine(2604) synthase RluF, partial [Prolixibacteraceae bacterium]|nr:23S rRNA pseudouridine(2604) synthase RluF [Prolixibacteraceae bacterium]
MEYKRLNKAISETGYCSRRAADAIISGGKVKVNGTVADLGVKVTARDEISVEGIIITKKVKNIYLAFNKPVGITCTTELDVKSNIISFIDYPER